MTDQQARNGMEKGYEKARQILKSQDNFDHFWKDWRVNYAQSR
jgi:hypothetical protein